MDERTLTALKASIKHWEENVAAKSPYDASVAGARCALCRAFYDGGCEGCPVFKSGKRRFRCSYTPYRRAAAALKRWRESGVGARKFRQFAQRELDFLRSLLPAPPAAPLPGDEGRR